MSQQVIIPGDSGRIEAVFHQGELEEAPIALVLHPHPLHGGTMNNKVTYYMFREFADAGFSVLRFNFRGVGKSQGEYGNGIGEVQDTLIVMDWAQNACPSAQSIWVSGFSFGSWIALQILMRRPEVGAFIAVAPPTDQYQFNFLDPTTARGLFVHGTKDEVASFDAGYKLYDLMRVRQNAPIMHNTIEGADHFFSEHMDEFRQSIRDFIYDVRSNIVVQPKRKKTKRKQKGIDMLFGTNVSNNNNNQGGGDLL